MDGLEIAKKVIHGIRVERDNKWITLIQNSSIGKKRQAK